MQNIEPLSSTFPTTHVSEAPQSGSAATDAGIAPRPLSGGENPREARTKAQTRYETRVRVVKAMAHSTRMFIVEELSRGERCVCDLTEMIGVDISTVSKHLSILKNAGILEDDKRGNQVFYRLRVPCIMDFFGCVESVLEYGSGSDWALDCK
jgi:ArsR family transcriptional regulator